MVKAELSPLRVQTPISVLPIFRCLSQLLPFLCDRKGLFL